MKFKVSFTTNEEVIEWYGWEVEVEANSEEEAKNYVRENLYKVVNEYDGEYDQVDSSPVDGSIEIDWFDEVEKL